MQPGREDQQENAKERQQAPPAARPVGATLLLSALYLHNPNCPRAMSGVELVSMPRPAMSPKPGQVVAILLQIVPPPRDANEPEAHCRSPGILSLSRLVKHTQRRCA